MKRVNRTLCRGARAGTEEATQVALLTLFRLFSSILKAIHYSRVESVFSFHTKRLKERSSLHAVAMQLTLLPWSL